MTQARRADIQGLRAMAVTVVVLYHAGLGFSGGFVGVDMFFVISGYVITRLLLRELHSEGTLRLRSFYARRAKRLLPSLALMLGVVLLASILLAPISVLQSTARTGASASLISANNYLAAFGGFGGYFDTASALNPLLHTWSLSVEEQFYLVFPAILLFAWRTGAKRRSSRAPATALAATGLLSFSLSLMLSYEWLDPGHRGVLLAFYSAPTRAWEFVSGAALAFAAPTLARLTRAQQELAGWIGAALVAVSVLLFDSSTAFPGVAALVPVAGTVAMIAAGERDASNSVSRLLSIRPLGLIGDVSYSWYLWHWPLIVFATAFLPRLPFRAPLGALVAFVLSVMLYRWFESPAREWRHRNLRQVAGLAATCALLPLGAVIALEAVSHPARQYLRAAPFQLGADFAAGCAGSQAADGDLERCRWPAPQQPARATVVLLGDSNASQLSDGFIAASQRANLDAHIRTMSACPIADFEVWNNRMRSRRCRRFLDSVVAEIVSINPAVVVVATAADSYINNRVRYRLLDPHSGIEFTSLAERAAAWTPAMADVLRPLSDHGISVVIVLPTPKFNDWLSDESPLLSHWLGAKWMDPGPFSKSDALSRRATAVAALTAAATLLDASTVDPFEQMCPRDPCAVLQDGTWLYRDPTHISAAQSIRLTGFLADSLEQTLDGRRSR